MTVRTVVQADDIDIAAEAARLETLGGGGIASFTGIVRGDGRLVELFLEHHPGMTGQALAALAAEAMRRWPLLGVTLVHRHGTLVPGARIVFVGTAAAHRAAALAACAFLIDRLKTVAPFWKRERFADGRERWVEPRAEDVTADARWEQA